MSSPKKLCISKPLLSVNEGIIKLSESRFFPFCVILQTSNNHNERIYSLCVFFQKIGRY